MDFLLPSTNKLYIYLNSLDQVANRVKKLTVHLLFHFKSFVFKTWVYCFSLINRSKSLQNYLNVVMDIIAFNTNYLKIYVTSLCNTYYVNYQIIKMKNFTKTLTRFVKNSQFKSSNFQFFAMPSLHLNFMLNLNRCLENYLNTLIFFFFFLFLFFL